MTTMINILVEKSLFISFIITLQQMPINKCVRCNNIFKICYQVPTNHPENFVQTYSSTSSNKHTSIVIFLKKEWGSKRLLSELLFFQMRFSGTFVFGEGIDKKALSHTPLLLSVVTSVFGNCPAFSLIRKLCRNPQET